MNLLKDESIEYNKLWKVAGKPRHGQMIMISMTVCREKMALSFGIVGNRNLNLEMTVFQFMVVLTTGKLLINSLFQPSILMQQCQPCCRPAHRIYVH